MPTFESLRIKSVLTSSLIESAGTNVLLDANLNQAFSRKIPLSSPFGKKSRCGVAGDAIRGRGVHDRDRPLEDGLVAVRGFAGR